MPGPRSVPGAPLGKMKQQPLLLARVKCDRKIGEAAGGGAGGAQLGSAGRGVPWQRGFRPHPRLPTATTRLQGLMCRVLGVKW